METQLVPVWSGSTWRDYPQPVVATSPVGRPCIMQGIHPRARVGLQNRAEVRACLTEVWISQGSLADATGLSVASVRTHLRDALKDGFAEMRESRSATRQNGEAVCVYRRRQVVA